MFGNRELECVVLYRYFKVGFFITIYREYVYVFFVLCVFLVGRSRDFCFNL